MIMKSVEQDDPRLCGPHMLIRCSFPWHTYNLRLAWWGKNQQTTFWKENKRSYFFPESRLWHFRQIVSITKTRIYSFDPLKPHFYIVKLGFTLFFLFLLKNIDCGYSLEPPRRGGSNECPQSMFWAEIWKISEFLSVNFHFFGSKIFSVFE